MSAVAVPTGTGLTSMTARLLAPPPVVRLVAFAALALFAALNWATLEAPAADGRLALCAAIALGVAAGGHACERLSTRARRVVALGALAIAAFVLVLAASGVPGRLLVPAHWGDLLSGIGQGIETLPGIGVPYRGVDPWVRIDIIAGGGLLLVLGGVLAMRALRRDRRPVGAAAVLAAAYVVPVVEHGPSHPFVWGAVFTVLVGALLWADRVERTYAAPAAVFIAVALGGAAVAAPRLDSDKPWIDYQAVIESLSTPPGIGFSWNHGYGPLDWPRDNREMVRIAAKTGAYWKAVDLDAFDGKGWRAEALSPPGTATEMAPNHRDWLVQLRVTIRDLRTPAYIGAGTALSIHNSPRYAIPAAPGTFATGREPLRRGDSYTTEVYSPHPSVRELRAAGTDYPSFVAPYLTMDLPESVGGPSTDQPGVPSTLGPVRLLFTEFGLLSLRQPPTALDPSGFVTDGATALRNSQYAEMYALVQRLRAKASNAYEFVHAVESTLATGYAYTEKPPAPRAGRPPLISFLFDTKAGYCQQFSGAMALMLRMGGVPTRVGSGFTSGTFDAARDEWVVRDVDAHSWVEAYFPKLGWIPFDPTPGVAPPHGQLAFDPLARDPRVPSLRPNGRRGDVAGNGADSGPGGGTHDSSVSIWVLLAGALGLGFAVAGTVFAVRARRREEDLPEELVELGRALRRTGRPIGPRMTLRTLEDRFRIHAPEAAAYVAAVRLVRFGGRPDGPTPQQRAALRDELASGLGAGGRLRAWWALPPRLPRPGRAYNRA